MAVRHVRIQVGADPAPLNVNEVGDPIPGRNLLVCNRSAIALDLGGDDVATGAGFALDPGDATSATLEGSEVMYAVGPDAGPYEVHVLLTGVV